MSSNQLEAVQIGPVDVVAAVIRSGARVLLCQRPAHKRHGGLYEFPGGKCNDGETKDQAIARELLEELGVTVTYVGSVLHSIHDPGSLFVIHFTDVRIDGTPLTIEHSDLQWVTFNEALYLDLAPSDRRFIEDFLDRAGEADCPPDAGHGSRSRQNRHHGPDRTSTVGCIRIGT